MRRLLGDRLPKFTAEQRRLINGSADFFGLNHYGTGWAMADLDQPGPDTAYASISEDGFKQAQSMWLFSSPWGFRKMLNWVKRRYQNPPLLVTENGWSVEPGKKEEAGSDQSRVQFYADYLSEMRRAIVEDGVNVKGYFGFSLMDNFEWSQGYVERFGVTYVDFALGKDEHAPASGSDRQPTSGRQVRLRKDSSCWLEEVWRTNAVVDPKAGGRASWACVKSDAFQRTFYFRDNPACTQHLNVSKGGRSGTITSVGDADDCEWGPKNVTIMGTTLMMHQDDADDLVGFWNRAENTVEWGNGAIWEAESHALPDVREAIKGLAGIEDHAWCPGYEKCPDYPKPYKYGEWPTSYKIEGEFPEGFIWGLGTASYQVEGGYRDDGRGASIWDTFSGADTVGMPGADCGYCCTEAPCRPHPTMADRGATGNVACDHYHEWRSDVALMKSMGLTNYRFSISWPRIVPTGRTKDGVEKRGIKFYSDLVDALLEEGITPYVTLYHWDLPQGLLDPPRVSGWWSRDSDGNPDGEIIQDWLDYCDIVFDALGDRVKYWVTFNEPWSFIFLGSGFGKAPGIREFSDMKSDPWVGAHNVLNAHAAAVNLYRTKYARKQGGLIGITNNVDWSEPKTDDPRDVAAADRSVLFQLGWFSEPIFGGNGDYPPEMRKLYGDRLPRFTTEQRRLLNGSADFFGLNHYGTSWAEYTPHNPRPDLSYATTSHDGFVQGASGWLFGSGWGFRKLLNWVHRRYPAYSIIVTEGGWSSRLRNATVEAKDLQRIQYYANYTSQMHKAIVEDGVDVRGYFAWSFLDNFEWEQGYAERFGVTFTEYGFGKDPGAPDTNNNWSQPTAGKQMRIRKDSSCWLEELWTTNKLLEPGEFGGCGKPAAVLGEYVDQRQTGCTWKIVNTSSTPRGAKVELQPLDTGSGTGCNSLASSGLLVGTTIVVDFVGKDKKTRRRSGYSNGKSGSILWGDGSVWKRFKAFGTSAEDYVKWVFMS
jgi:beta-glucosidase/6-phospho-beta-glucosidase/beta-galactosidase